VILFLFNVNPLCADDLERIYYDIFNYDQHVTVDLDFSPVFDSALVKSLKQGFPVHIELVIELKKSYPFWFDPTLSKHQVSVHVEYKSFGSRFNLNMIGFEGQEFEKDFKHITQLLEELNELLILKSKSIKDLNLQDNYYLSFELELRRLTLVEIKQAGQWYLGHEDTVERNSDDSKNFPEQAFGQILDMAGMGPSRLKFSSYNFKPVRLKIIMP
jgi:hypothetical protein